MSQHRYVVEQHYGVKLLPGETVHHRNGVRDDNRIENLEVWARGHPGGQRIEEMVEYWRAQLARWEPLVGKAGKT